jgi:hypothetical protein
MKFLLLDKLQPAAGAQPAPNESRSLTGSARMPILDPTSLSQDKRYQLAARRLRTLDGAMVGLLDNSKLNAAPLLAAIGDLLKSFMVRTKGHGFSYPVEEPIAKEMAEQCDVVIAAIGD